jgi:hypothetical protein
MNSSDLLVAPLFLGIVLIHAGAFLVYQSWFPRRSGKDSFCRKCGYNLRGLQTNSCPECGNFLTSRTIVKGQRLRRKWMGLFGLSFALLGFGAILIAVNANLRNIDWETHKPFFWLLSNLESTDSAVRDHAWPECTRRFAASELSNSDKSRLDASICRVIARGGAPNAMRSHVVDRYASLTDAQKNIVFASLLADLQGNAYVALVAAEGQLESLIAHNLLTASQTDQLDQLALNAQASKTRMLALDWLLNFIGDRAAANALAPQRRELFFTQAMSPVLSVRPETVAGIRVPFRIAYEGRGPDRNWWSREELLSVALDDNPPQQQGSSGTGNGFTSGSMGSSIAGDLSPGKHVLHVTIRNSAFIGAYPSANEKQPPFWTRTLTLSAPFLALPKTTANDITLIDDPASADSIRQSITIRDLRAKNKAYDRLSMTVSIKNPPCNIAFDLIARCNGKDYAIGNVYSNAGEDHNFGVSTRDFPPGASTARIDLLLRASPTVARDTIDLYEIWNGQVTIPNLSVQREP